MARIGVGRITTFNFFNETDSRKAQVDGMKI